MMIVVGVIEVAPEQRGQFLTSRIEAIRATRLEPGCLDYCFAADCIDAGTVRVFERWSDAAALSTHLTVVADREQSSPDPIEVLGREFIRYEADAAGALKPSG